MTASFKSPSPSLQSGVALITAILVVALAAILATSLVSHLNFDIRRTQNILSLDQAYLFNAKYVAASRGLLYEDRSNNEIDTLQEAQFYNDTMGLLPEDKSGAVISSSITDLQGRFNLNNLASQPGDDLNRYRTGFLNLLAVIEIDEALREPLADSLIDWLDADSNPTSAYGAEFDYYLGLEPAYRAANQMMESVSELRQVKGYDRDIYRALKDHVCALPITNSPININTASREVLESVAGLQGHGDTVIGARDGKPDTADDDAPYENIADFAAAIPALNNKAPEGITVHSEYFLIRNKIQTGKNQVTFYNMINRNQNGQTRLLRISRGTL